jgi:hypothetical protein
VFCPLGRLGLSRPLCWRARQVRALLWPLFDRSAWAHAASVVADTTGGALLWPLFAWSAWAQPATGGGHDWFGHCFGLCSLVRRGLSHPLWWWARLLSAFLWPLFAWSAGAQTLVNLCIRQPLRWRARQMMASVCLVAVGSAKH